jgi:hypothetical protein
MLNFKIAERYNIDNLEGRYFDIHYFVDDFHTKQEPKIIFKAKPRTA